MIKVLIILIVLVLSGIFAYLTLTNKKGGSSNTLAPDPSSKSEKGKDEPEPEPVPAKEDPGTCELSGDWAMSDECNADGTAIFTQTYKESKPGACPANEKARVKPCCYQKGDWKDTTPCDQGGRKTQEQTTINCSSELKTRRVDCPYVGEWKKVGGCVEGKQIYSRLVVNSDEPISRTENCCELGPWKNQLCYPNNSVLQSRARVNCGGAKSETRTLPNKCRYSKCTVQTWKHSNFRDHTWAIRDSVRNVRDDPRSKHSKHDEVTSYKKWGGNCSAVAYEHPGYRGRGLRLLNGGHNVPGWFNDKLSSIRITHHPYKI